MVARICKKTIFGAPLKQMITTFMLVAIGDFVQMSAKRPRRKAQVCSIINNHKNHTTNFPITECATLPGDTPGSDKPCVFPFIMKQGNVSVTHDGCTNYQDPDGKFWCSTKTDENHFHFGESGNWGYCPKYCRKDDGETLDQVTN